MNLTEHKKMITAIMQLPEILEPQIFRTSDSKIWRNHCKAFWHLIGLRIDYLQMIQAGYLPPDPLDYQELHPLQREYINLVSRWKFSILNLIIEGFEEIKTAANCKGRSFSFLNPRELFAEMCREMATSQLSNGVSQEINHGMTMKEVRSSRTELNAFYIDRDGSKKREILDEFQNSEWCVFWIFALWNYRDKHKFKDLWKKFLRMDGNLTRFIKKTKPCDGKKLLLLKWNCGNAINHLGQPALFADPSILNLS